MKIKLTTLLFIARLVDANSSTCTQVTKPDLAIHNKGMVELFREIEEKSGFHFFYQRKDLEDLNHISVGKENSTALEIPEEVFSGTGIAYKVVDRNIIAKKELLAPESNQFAMQQKYVSGSVTDEAGQPLPGVTVIIKGTAKGTVTSIDGKYSLPIVPDNAVLQFSFVGMVSQEVEVGNQTTINITMEADVIGIEEVVAIAYGTQKQRFVTGSISGLDAEKLEDMPVGQISQKLQGKIAGVQLNQITGSPGSELAVRIRGAASINAGNNPLYVVDGSPLVGSLKDINPDEIQNISVLKGASATSLYGSRAANGVVLVTTKKAREGQSEIQFRASYGVSNVPQRGRPEMMNSREFLEDRKALWEDKIRYQGYKGEVPEIYQNPEAWTGPDTDWYDVLLQTGKQSNYNLTLLSGKGKISSASTIGYYSEKGIMTNSGYERFSLRSNKDYEVNKFIKLGLNIAPTYSKYNNISSDGFYNTLEAAIMTPPIFSPDEKNPDGTTKLSFTGPGLFTFPNWVVTLEDQINLSENIRLLSNVYGEIDFLKYFNFKSEVSTEIFRSRNRIFYPSTTGTIFYPPPSVQRGIYNTNNYTSWTFENILNFNKTFYKNHHVGALLGYSAQEYRQEYVSLLGTNFPDDEISWLDAAATISNWENSPSSWSMVSLFGRINYDFKEKYLLSASLRQDGSSRFGSRSKWGTFPSISAGWIISEEEFAKNWSSISYLKVRAEYGVVGNNNIGNYTQYGNVTTTDYVFNNELVSGRSQTSLENNELTWETTSGIDVGIDMYIFKDRIGLMADYYDKTTDDMLYQIDIPWGSGFSNIQSNIGEIHTWGYEFSLNSRNFVKEFKWKTDLNISFPRNKVIQLGTNNTPIGAYGDWTGNVNRTAVGHPAGMFWGYVSDGVYMTQEEFDTQPKHITSQVGSAKYKDVSGLDGIPDGKITVEDKTFIGNPNPDFIFGITNTFSYKNFDLDISASGTYGNDVFIGSKEWGETLEGIFNIEKYMIDRWRSPEDPGSGIIPRTLSSTLPFNRVPQSRYVEDGTHLTINNITLSYTLPHNKILGKTRLYFSVQQALVLTNYSGPNPEASNWGLNGLREGVDSAAYPLPRRLSIGIDITF